MYIQANPWAAGRHVYADPIITVDEDTAHVDSDWVWFNPDLVPTRAGRYSDDLRRVDGRWVFTVRRISIAFDREASEVLGDELDERGAIDTVGVTAGGD